MSPKSVKGVPLSNFPLIEDNPLVLGAEKISWEVFENAPDLFEPGFVSMQPLRRMFGLLILEKIRKAEDDDLLQQWLEVPVMQYFTGEELFHWDLPVTKEEIQVFRSQLSSKGKSLVKSMVDVVRKI